MADWLDQKPPDAGMRLSVDPGAGNLLENAHRAAVVGPYRLAHGSKRTINLQAGESEQVSSLSSAARHAAYVSLYLPASRTGSLAITVSRDDTQGDTSGVPVVLEPRAGPGASFQAVLLPGETLYAQCATDAQIVVNEVAF